MQSPLNTLHLAQIATTQDYHTESAQAAVSMMVEKRLTSQQAHNYRRENWN